MHFSNHFIEIFSEIKNAGGGIFKNKKLGGEEDLWNKLTIPNPLGGPYKDQVKSEIPLSNKMAGMCTMLDFLDFENQKIHVP